MDAQRPAPPEHLDVLIVGAGLSGIAAACHLQRAHPARSYALLEARAATGGTWDLFRYPGARSDSDLHTYGYAFRPWRSARSLAGRAEILAYLREAAAAHGIDRRIRLHHRVVRAAWSTADARWTVEVERADTGERLALTCAWLFGATGYFRYDAGHAPRFEGSERFPGRIIHPQRWPEDLDCAGLRVVVIGSGATAVTLVPALAATAAHVTMLQRTPSYVLSLRSRDPVATLLARLLPGPWAHALTRWKNVRLQRAVWRACRRFPRQARWALRWRLARELPRGYPVSEHFDPPYAPWDQRLCVAADGDLFRAIRAGRASVVTGRIAGFTERGVLLASGRTVPADVIVTATGLELLALGGVALTVDGAPVHLPDRIAFRGMMLDGVPNLAFAAGYPNASWTLRIDLVCEHLCRLLAFMDRTGSAICRPERPPGMATRPLLDLAAGYVQRAAARLPRQGTAPPWTIQPDYAAERRLLRRGPVEDPCLRFSAAADGAASGLAR
jgi:cation diffusion facilitator CzcD-associated flavoprotein CzcO